MPSLNKFKSRKEWEAQVWDKLTDGLLKADSRKEIKQTLETLLTAYEKKQIINRTSAKVLIWLGSCYGSCDLPLGLEKLGVDLVISWGHNQFRKEEW